MVCAAEPAVAAPFAGATAEEMAYLPVVLAILCGGDTPAAAMIRQPAEDFVDVERFRAMKAEGALRPADDVAADILRLEAEGRLRGDAIQDLRTLA